MLKRGSFLKRIMILPFLLAGMSLESLATTILDYDDLPNNSLNNRIHFSGQIVATNGGIGDKVIGKDLPYDRHFLYFSNIRDQGFKPFVSSSTCAKKGRGPFADNAVADFTTAAQVDATSGWAVVAGQVNLFFGLDHKCKTGKSYRPFRKSFYCIIPPGKATKRLELDVRHGDDKAKLKIYSLTNTHFPQKIEDENASPECKVLDYETHLAAQAQADERFKSLLAQRNRVKSLVGFVAVHETSRRVESATVIASHINGEDWQETSTDTNGNYVFYNLPAGKYRISVYANGYKPWSMSEATWLVEDGVSNTGPFVGLTR